MYKALDIAKYIVTKCSKDDMSVNNLRLQYILYLAQCKYLKRHGVSLFKDDITARKFGPSVPDVYYCFSIYAANLIDMEFKDVPNLTDMDRSLIDSVIEESRDRSLSDMIKEVQAEGGAWDKTFRNGEGDRHIIPLRQIAEEYEIADTEPLIDSLIYGFLSLLSCTTEVPVVMSIFSLYKSVYLGNLSV